MGRAGGGSHSSGGSHHSGGGHSVSRSSGGHRVSSGGSSRAGSGIRPSGFTGGTSRRSAPPPPPPRGGYGAPPPPPPPHTVYHRSYGPRRHTNVYVSRRRSSFGSTLASLIIVMVFIAVVWGMLSFMYRGSTDSVSSTINREPLTDSAAFINDCIVDELGWFDNESRTGRELQQFYEKTGVQPFIVLHEYDPSLTSDEEKEAWAQAYYEANIDNENTFLYVYFAEMDTDNDVGYMCYVNGIEVSSVMDSEAIEIFWNYIDQYWYTDMSTDDLFVKVFDRTADTIMRVSTTGADVAKTAVLIVGVLLILIVLFCWWKAKAKREKEKAAETERILNTPMQDLVNQSKADDLTKKYDNME